MRLTLNEIAAIVGLQPKGMNRYTSFPDFPKPVSSGPPRRFDFDSVKAWMQARETDIVSPAEIANRTGIPVLALEEIRHAPGFPRFARFRSKRGYSWSEVEPYLTAHSLVEKKSDAV